ncbi:MAG: iron-sulfur cluster assembly protein [Candidatus Zixiibacteriota bacterium]
MELTKELILEHISPIEDPEIHIGLVDLGLIYDIDITADSIVKVTMTLTSPMCPIGPELVSQISEKIRELDEVKDVVVDIVWDPPWDPYEMASDEAKDELGLW